MPINEFVFCFDAQYTKFWSQTRPYDYGMHSKIPPTMGGSKVSTFNLQSTDPATTAMPSITLTPSQPTSQPPRQYYPTSQTGMSNTIITSSEQSSLKISGAFTSSYNSKSSSFFSTLTHTNIDDGELIKPPMPTPSEPEYEMPTLKEIKTLANEVKGLSESKCSLCSEVSTKVVYCNECKEHYCQQCVELAHRHVHHSFEHCIQKASEEASDEPKCSVHPGNFLTLYCKEDEVLCCEQCFEREHAGHTALRLEDAVAVVQETLAQRMEELEKEVSEARTGKKDDEISRKIGKKERKLRKAIDKREKGLCSEIDEMFGADQGTSGTTAATSSSPSSVGESGGMPHIHEIDPPVSEIEVRRKGKCAPASAKAHGSRYVVAFDERIEQVTREISEFGEVIEKETKK